MKPTSFLFLADENIDAEVVSYLRDRGYDVLDIKEQKLWGLSDRKILQLAWQQRRVVISQDSDFGTLIFRDKMDVCGVFYLRPGHESPNFHINTLEAILSAELDFSFPFMLVGENNGSSVRIRLRRLGE